MKYWNSSYLKLAEQVLNLAQTPLSARQILAYAEEHSFLPTHLFGETMHKTLNARISEHIRYHKSSAKFFRTAPGVYFLHSLANAPSTPDSYKNVYLGEIRAKKIRKEDVLVIPRDIAEHKLNGQNIPFVRDKFESIIDQFAFFADRANAETDDSIKQFVTFTVVHHGSNVLTYRRGKYTTTSDRLKGQRSVGFGGHINSEDFDLFLTGVESVFHNAARELLEELFIDEYARSTKGLSERFKPLGLINVDDTPDAEHHIAVVVAYSHSSMKLPRSGELSINQLEWVNTDHPLNDLSDFDLWSEMILQHIFHGKYAL